ncbi:hypothetical protein N7453_010647 [Penicillium expansum]|nr:hypothetical protein N7453_010647 [Penicillium expansum]
MRPDDSGNSSLAAAIPLRRHDNQPEGWKAHHSIHSLAFDLSHVVTRRDHCLSTPLLPCPYPISPLTFTTTEVFSKQTTKNAIDSLCSAPDRGIIGALLVGHFSASVLRFSSSFYHPPSLTLLF